jgi:hypothetical protein
MAGSERDRLWLPDRAPLYQALHATHQALGALDRHCRLGVLLSRCRASRLKPKPSPGREHPLQPARFGGQRAGDEFGPLRLALAGRIICHALRFLICAHGVKMLSPNPLFRRQMLYPLSYGRNVINFFEIKTLQFNQ